jgi:LysM repeat protein
MKAICERGALMLFGMADVVALWRLTPSPNELMQGLVAPHAWISRVGADTAIGEAAAALLWCAALWLLLGLLVTLAATVVRRPDSALERLSRRLTPALIRRLVATSTGASLVLTPVAATGAPVHSPPFAGVSASSAAATSTSAPASDASMSRSATEATPTLPPVQHTPGPPLDPAPATSTVLVTPGDSLWRLSAQRLGSTASERQIAVDWPYWYRANRKVIGRDPNLLRPGEQLTVPVSEKGP